METLFRANLANSNLCYLCLETKQELQHMLVSCQFIAEFWEVFLDPWYKSHVSIELELSTIKIFYSIIGNNHVNKLSVVSSSLSSGKFSWTLGTSLMYQ